MISSEKMLIVDILVISKSEEGSKHRDCKPSYKETLVNAFTIVIFKNQQIYALAELQVMSRKLASNLNVAAAMVTTCTNFCHFSLMSERFFR